MLISIEDMLLFIYIYVFCFLGAFSKDMLDIFLEKIPKVLIFKVLISSLAVTVLIFGASEYLIDKLSYKPFTAICYIFGIISFELLSKYSNTKEILDTIEEFKRWKKVNK